jgi:mannitol/fructose-specific phosphotransferase system IIA component (Ntr-type)
MPSGSQREYLGLLAQVMLTLKVPGFRERLTACDTPEEILEVLNTNWRR